MGKLLVLSLCGLILAACGGGESPPVATPIPFGRDESPQLAIMAPEIAELLRNLPWARDGSEETEQLLREIAGAQLPRPNLGQERVPEIVQLIEILGEQHWYRDGLDGDEKFGLTGLFRTYNSLLSGRRNTATGEQEYAFEGEYNFPALYASAIEQKRFAVTKPGTTSLTFIALGEIGDEGKAEEALRHATTYINDIVRLAGTVKSTTILIIIEPNLEICGWAYSAIYATQIRPDCVTPTIVVHELTHLATPDVFETWFEEGTAYWVAQHLAPIDTPLRESAQLRRETTFDTGCCIARDDEYAATVRGAAAFWYDLELIIGAEAVGNAIKAVPGGVGREAIPAIIRFTPADKQAAVRSLITERCREYRQARMLPCTIPAR